MRVVWKDSAKAQKEYRYRNYEVKPFRNGWVTTIEGDNNIYKALEDAQNAIDDVLGGHGQLGVSERRRKREIRILGILG